MTCKSCGCDKYNVVKVLRNRRLKDGKFVVNDNIDSRFIVCILCGSRYITETFITHEIVYKSFRQYSKNIVTKQEQLFTWEGDQ